LKGRGGVNNLDGGTGFNKLEYLWIASGGKAEIDMNNHWANHWDDGVAALQQDSVFNFNIIVGSIGNDTLIGTSGNDVLVGSSGNDFMGGLGGVDTIFGEGGIDSLYGDDGNDELYGGLQADVINGGNGTDNAHYENDGRGGGVTITLDGVANDADGDNVMNDVEGVYGTSFADTLNASARASAVILHGLGGNDTLTGGSANDTLYGEDGNDTFYVLNGGADSIFGGNGTDAAQKDATDILNSIETIL
jgi:Ca2+-binding RTX toxin-like protein